MKPTSIKIIEKLRAAGFEAYWAGGCVRDIILGIQPKDYDIVTSAKPDEIEAILEKTIAVGKQFGVIIALENGHHFEIATFRSDSGYSDGRRPDAVVFTDVKEDAFRRDFTINGMFYDPIADEIIDYVGGQKDIEARLIRFIGDPSLRIKEDHLRILRAVRFKNCFSFQYEPKTYNALCDFAELVVDGVSWERIGSELYKMMMNHNAVKAFDDLEDTGILKVILPEMLRMKGCPQPFQYHQEGDVWNHSMAALASLPESASAAVRWATVLHDIGKPETFDLKERIRFDSHCEVSADIARDVLNRLKFSKRFVDEVCWLISHHMMMMPLLTMAKGKKMKWYLHEWFLNLMAVFKADALGTTPSDLSLYEKIYNDYHESVSVLSKMPEPLLSGREVMDVLKISPGKRVGEIIELLHEKQLSGEISTHDEALLWLASLGNQM